MFFLRAKIKMALLIAKCVRDLRRHFVVKDSAGSLWNLSIKLVPVIATEDGLIFLLNISATIDEVTIVKTLCLKS